MPFLPPNQQRQSTEGKVVNKQTNLEVVGKPVGDKNAYA